MLLVYILQLKKKPKKYIYHVLFTGFTVIALVFDTNIQTRRRQCGHLSLGSLQTNVHGGGSTTVAAVPEVRRHVCDVAPGPFKGDGPVPYGAARK